MSQAGAEPHDIARYFRPTSTLAIFVIAGLAIISVLNGVSLVGGLIAMRGVGVFGGTRDNDIISLSMLVYGLAALAQILVFVPTVVLFCIWTFRSAVNARTLGARGFRITPGWAVGWYFIPVATLWMPFKAMSEIWRASIHPIKGDDRTAWRNAPVGVLLQAWWTSWVLGTLVTNIASRFFDEPSFERIGAWMISIGAGLQILAGVLCIAVVSRLTTSQRRRAADARTMLAATSALPAS
ncbi:MAG: DUF4328 domain-containing protein [Phycisphaerales bacterium]